METEDISIGKRTSNNRSLLKVSSLQKNVRRFGEGGKERERKRERENEWVNKRR